MKPQRIIIPKPGTPWGGLRTSVAPTLIGENELSKAENAEWVNNQIRKRPGTKDDEGSVNASSSYPRKAYNFVKANGTEVPIQYDRSSDGSAPKLYQGALGATWTWNAIQYSGSDMVLQDARAPAFLTIAGKLLISNGDYNAVTPADTQGLIEWSGTGNAGYIYETDPYHSISVRHLCYYKGHVVGAYGYVCTAGTWDTVEYTSGIFYSQTTNASGNLVDPDSPHAWRLAADTMYELEPEDGSWITGLWVRYGNIYLSKETGIWVIFGDIRTAKAQRVSHVGIPDGSTLEEFNGRDVFLGKDGFYEFDGQSEARRIDDAISNLVPMIPTFDIDGDGLELNIISRTDWENVPSATPSGYNAEGDPELTEDIRFNETGDDGYIDLAVATAQIKTGCNQNTATELQNLTGSSGFGFRMDSTGSGDGYFSASEANFVLSKVILPIQRNPDIGGTVDFYFIKGEINKCWGASCTIIDSFDIPLSDLSESIDINDSATWYEADFGADASVTEAGYYWVVVRWSNPAALRFGTVVYSGPDYYVMHRNASANWVRLLSTKGAYILYETGYETTGTYHVDNEKMDLTAAPDKWGYFRATVTNYSVQSIKFWLRTSTDQSSWSDWRQVYPDEIITEELDKRQYVDVKIVLKRLDEVTTPRVDDIKIVAFAETGEEIERLIYSTTFNDKYLCATNENLDGEYRTFALDKQGRWAIYPDQYIRGYMKMENDTYLLTLDTNAQFHRMLKGTASDQFDYDYSVKKITSTTWYYMTFRLKKLDCGFPNILKRFRESDFSVGSIFADTFVLGTIRYRTDDGSWTTRYFNNKDTVGDTQVFRMQYSEVWGYYIEIEFETYYSGSTDYGSAFNFKDMILDFFTYRMRPQKEVTSSVPVSGGHMVE